MVQRPPLLHSRTVRLLSRWLPAALLALGVNGFTPRSPLPTDLDAAWGPEAIKALDRAGDVEAGGSAGDLLWFHAREDEGILRFRIGLHWMKAADGTERFRDSGVSVRLYYDAASAAPSSGDGWDACIAIDPERAAPRAALREDARTGWTRYAASVERFAGGAKKVEPAAGLAVSSERNRIEVSVPAPDGYVSGGAVRYRVETVLGGRVLDTIEATEKAAVGAHNVAFVQHGNQGMTYTTVFRGERGETPGADGSPSNPDDGFDEILAAHQYYNLPANLHLAATLQTAAEWHDPTFNDWMVTGVTAGWIQTVTSAYAQHMMPFVRNTMNDWAVEIERDMTNWRYGGDARVAWVPERVWVSNPDNDGNGIDASMAVIDNLDDAWLPHGVQAVILDDYIHCGYRNGAFDDHHVYVIPSGLKILPIDNDFVGQMNWDAGAAWNTIIGGTSDEIILYGNDWEIAAEVSQGASFTSALNNYIYILQQCSANSGTVSVWKLNDVLTSFGTTSITLQNGTYGLLGEFYGYGGGNNQWYRDWAAYNGAEHSSDQHNPRWNYGQIWDAAITKILSCPDNDLSQSAWYTLMSMLHETGWHDGGYISGWIHRYSNHMKNANVYAEASRWAAGLYTNPTGAYLSDVDEDGVEEGVIYNDRVMAVFESVGGRAVWVFAKGTGYGYSVVGNCPVYWADTEGDYNEVNHTAALSDVSVAGLDREHDLYGLSVLTGSGSTVELLLSHPAVEKRVRLTLGNPYLDCIYDAAGQDVYIKSGWSPDLVDLIWNAQSDRIWQPTPAGRYFGQRNPNTGATGAVVVGTAGAQHNLQFSATLLDGDEWKGSGQFEFYLYAGHTTAPDGQGRVAELEALATGLADVLGPAPFSGSYFPTPNRLVLNFNEPVVASSFVVTGVSLDDDGDDVADVTLTSASTVRTTGTNRRIEIDVASATAAAIEALNPADVRLLLAANTARDAASNGNAAVHASDNVRVIMEAATLVTIDGYIDPAEWTVDWRVVNDPNDSQWTSSNEIDALFCRWDATYLYVAVDGIVHSNSWILYLDTDPDGPEGQTDLRAIDTWERGALFTAVGFRPDYQYGAYQHQGAYDGDSFWRILTATTTEDLTSAVLHAVDAAHVYGGQGGSELAIPWDALYGLGPGRVPPDAEIGLVCSICWDPEPNGVLGGDVAPNNVSATLPTVDNFHRVVVDANGDGYPDGTFLGTPETGPVAGRLLAPNPFSAGQGISVVMPASPAGPAGARLDVFDVSGRRVATLWNGPLAPGAHRFEWDGLGPEGRPAGAGVYLVRFETGGMPSVRKIILIH
jgi:hypothetical protein